MRREEELCEEKRRKEGSLTLMKKTINFLSTAELWKEKLIEPQKKKKRNKANLGPNNLCKAVKIAQEKT